MSFKQRLTAYVFAKALCGLLSKHKIGIYSEWRKLLGIGHYSNLGNSILISAPFQSLFIFTEEKHGHVSKQI